MHPTFKNVIDLSGLLRERGDKHRLPKRFGLWVNAVLIALLVILFMGLWRGLWFDELLHFAFGGMTFEYAIRTIDYTTIHVNHGQTGAYFLLDWLLLQVFGASAVVLRSPSWVSAAILLTSVAIFLWAKGFSWRWSMIAIGSIGANETLMFFAGEARPYMVIASCAVAMLTYYALADRYRRRWWGRSLGFFGFVIGSTMHPYWLVLWVTIAAFSMAANLYTNSNFRGFRQYWKFLAPGFWIPSLVLYVTIALLTWARRVLNFGWPDSIYNWGSLTNSFLQNHFAFVPYIYPARSGTGEFDAGNLIPAVILALTLMTAVWLLLFKDTRSRTLIPPLVLFTLAAGTSAFFSYLSIRSQYIIFERQWVAGMALCTLALTWFFAEWWRNTRDSKQLSSTPVVVFVLLVGVSLLISIITQLTITTDRYQTWQLVKNDDRSVEDLMTAAVDAESFMYEPLSPEEGYGYLANINVARGGPVWEIFVAWYNKEAGLRHEFRDSDTNWTDWIWDHPSPQSFLCLPERQWQCPSVEDAQ